MNTELIDRLISAPRGEGLVSVQLDEIMIGEDATDDQAWWMIERLRQLGYDVDYGAGDVRRSDLDEDQATEYENFLAAFDVVLDAMIAAEDV